MHWDRIGKGKGKAVAGKGGERWGPREVILLKYVGDVGLPAPPPRPGSSSNRGG